MRTKNAPKNKGLCWQYDATIGKYVLLRGTRRIAQSISCGFILDKFKRAKNRERNKRAIQRNKPAVTGKGKN